MRPLRRRRGWGWWSHRGLGAGPLPPARVRLARRGVIGVLAGANFSGLRQDEVRRHFAFHTLPGIRAKRRTSTLRPFYLLLFSRTHRRHILRTSPRRTWAFCQTRFENSGANGTKSRIIVASRVQTYGSGVRKRRAKTRNVRMGPRRLATQAPSYRPTPP